MTLRGGAQYGVGMLHHRLRYFVRIMDIAIYTSNVLAGESSKTQLDRPHRMYVSQIEPSERATCCMDVGG